MNEIIDISTLSLATAYLLLIIPLSILLFMKIPLFKETIIAIIRMTVQLLFVGLYLQVVFDFNNLYLNLLWVIVMIIVADLSILKSCKLKMKRYLLPLFIALIIGTIVPLLVFIGPVLNLSEYFDAQYVIPLAGMILGNCLRADIIGLNSFFMSIQNKQKTYHQSLTYGATKMEALMPYFREALHAALSPTIASMATIGLVALPGMMTGVIMAGADPFTAIKYQIAIMIAIFSGTALNVFIGIWLVISTSFNAFGILHNDVFSSSKKMTKRHSDFRVNN
jgi:putative ABC transport system permease protein